MAIPVHLNTCLAPQIGFLGNEKCGGFAMVRETEGFFRGQGGLWEVAERQRLWELRNLLIRPV